MTVARSNLNCLSVKCFCLFRLTSISRKIAKVNQTVLADVVQACHFGCRRPDGRLVRKAVIRTCLRKGHQFRLCILLKLVTWNICLNNYVHVTNNVIWKRNKRRKNIWKIKNNYCFLRTEYPGRILLWFFREERNRIRWTSQETSWESPWPLRTVNRLTRSRSKKQNKMDKININGSLSMIISNTLIGF